MRVTAALDPRLASLVRATPAATAAAVDALVPVAVLTRSRTTETAVVDVPGAGRIVRKRRWWPRAADRAKGAFRTTIAAASPARREHEALGRLRRLPPDPFAPAPLGWTESRRGGVLHACTLLLEEVEGAVDLGLFLRDERDARRRARVLGDLALRTRAMHAAGIADGDHHPRNVLVAGGRTWRVDCAKQRVHRGPLAPSAIVSDLAALDVGLVRLATAAERVAFLAAATGVPPDPAFLARLDAARSGIDARECKRLPPTTLPPDNER